MNAGRIVIWGTPSQRKGCRPASQSFDEPVLVIPLNIITQDANAHTQMAVSMPVLHIASQSFWVERMNQYVHRMSPSHLRLGVPVLAASLALVACGGNADTEGEPESGGTLTYLEHQPYDTLYPPAAGFYPNGAVINNIADRLLWQDPETLELHPWIATDLPEVNDDATEFTFTIRDDVTYSDGTELTAENVVKNFDLYGQGDSDRTLSVSEAINNYDYGEVIDETTVRFHFTEPAPGFAQAASTINSGLLSDETLDHTQEDFGPGNATTIIGSGPFVVAEEELGTEYTLEAREDYDWAPEEHDHQGPAQIDAVQVIVTPEDSVRIGSLVSGQADVARQIEAQDEEQLENSGASIEAYGTKSVNNGFNFRIGHPILEDLETRQAIIHAVDREAVLENLFTDSYPLATSPLASDALGYSDQSEHYEYDPDRAIELLEEAGWEEGPDGIRERDGERLQLTVNEAHPQPRSAELVTVVAQQLREVGIELELLSGDRAQQNEEAQDPELVQIFHSMVGRADYDVIKSQYHSENRNVLLNGYDEDVTDPELESLLEDIASLPNEADRVVASEQAQQYLAENAYVLPFFEEPQVYGVQPHVLGFETESVARPSFYGVSLDD